LHQFRPLEPLMSMNEVINQALREYAPTDERNPFAAWAGECALFVDVACQIADENGVQYAVGNAYKGEIEGDFELSPPPGLTLDDVTSFNIIRNLDHIWLVHDGRHFDASTAEGAHSFFDLRIVRQVAVEMIRRHAPDKLIELCAVHEYWRTSVRLFDEYLAIIQPETNPAARHPGR
jgi:hypothetical protein